MFTMSSAQFMRVMKIYGIDIYRHVGGDTNYKRKVYIMSHYDKSVSLFVLEVLICEESLEIMHFGIANIKPSSYLKIQFMPVFIKQDLKIPICAFKGDFKTWIH